MTLCSLGFASYNLLIQKKRNRPTLLEHLHEFKAVIVVILHCCFGEENRMTNEKRAQKSVNRFVRFEF